MATRMASPPLSLSTGVRRARPGIPSRSSRAVAWASTSLGAYLASAAREPSRFSVFDAVCAAVHVHGLAGDLGARELGQRSLIASDLIDFLPAAQQLLE